MFNIKKGSISPRQLLRIFTHHCQPHLMNCCIYSDGSKDDGAVAFAYVHNEYEFLQRIQPIASVFTPELYAIYQCHNQATEQTRHSPITIFTDACCVIQAIVKFPSTNSLAQLIRCRIIALTRPVRLCWVPSHIGVTFNELADTLAKNGLWADEHPVPLPTTDFKNYVKQVVTERWRQTWGNGRPPENKCRSISQSIQPLADALSTNRSWAIKFCRLRIGHTSLTYSFLVSNDPLPYCSDCLIPLAVSHILTECQSHSDERSQYFGNGPYCLQTLLSPPISSLNGPLHRFLVQINLILLI